ncbi:REP-associated tyrosine transposase, partial [Legionella cincinnatiensis]|uniref:REP-associated tyrosine transposase n=1 Tax=Legionella cincinnatiensis TaxID=28085 RepID=UPI00104175FE
MVNYRRDKTRGGAYFFTLALKDRTSKVLTNNIASLRRSFRRARRNNFFIIKAIVVLPEHMHLLMELPEEDADYSTRLRQIKTYFLHELLSAGAPLLKNQKNEYNLWQRRFWEHRIRNESDFCAHVNYIHFNPVKHGWVKEVIDWPYSSFHKYVREGM